MTEPREEARLRFSEDRHVFVQLAQEIAQRIRVLSIDARLDCTVTHRAKDVGSFVKKAVIRGLTDPWNEIYDKAGVRIVVRHSGDLATAETLIRENFQVLWSSLDESPKEDDEDRLRYPRIHFQIKLYQPTNPDPTQPHKGYDCEVQLRTAASDLWASMSHKLLYKPSSGLPKDVRRSLYGLLALVEVYDREVQRAMDIIGESSDHFLNTVIDQCERIYYTFCTNAYNSELTRESVAVVLSTMNVDQQARYPEMLEEFAKRERYRLSEIYDRYGSTSEAYKNGLFVLLGQPESIAIFERLTGHSMLLEHAWQARLPEGLLEELQRVA
ncbi:GTP pyrophosphokinase family protein [Micromonospora sp. 067-2]|uniref:GTP pyrophosphokinase n=1 Tax=Micromonospora sp. 067-2 TaxID=2789270 RepID=UPI003978C9C8